MKFSKISLFARDDKKLTQKYLRYMKVDDEHPI